MPWQIHLSYWNVRHGHWTSYMLGSESRTSMTYRQNCIERALASCAASLILPKLSHLLFSTCQCTTYTKRFAHKSHEEMQKCRIDLDINSFLLFYARCRSQLRLATHRMFEMPCAHRARVYRVRVCARGNYINYYIFYR